MSRWINSIFAGGAAELAVLGLIACGGTSGNAVVRVGDAAISKTAVDHLMTVLAGGRLGGSSPARRRALRQQALSFLISSDWAIGEAAAQGLDVSEAEIARRAAAKERSAFPGGEAELHEFQRQTGQSLADLRFEAKAELAASKIRQALTRREPRIRRAQIADYYAHNKRRFVVPERRELFLTNRKSAAAVAKLRREVRKGLSFASVAEPDTVERTSASGPHGSVNESPLEKAIYSAKANVLTGPVKLRVDYFVFEVTRITPRAQRTLAQVQGKIERQLATEQQHRAMAKFVKEWRSRWKARTDCSPGYVVYRCKQYAGPLRHEDPLSLS